MKLLIEHISKSYGNLTVLNDLSLTLEQDPCYCLMSPSGSGKTTLLRILMGLDRKSTRLNSSHIQKSRMPSSA